MITVTAFQNQPVGVFGLGKAGLATIASLLAGSSEVWAWDDNDAARKKIIPQPKCHLAPLSEWPWEKLHAFVPSPGLPLNHDAVRTARQKNVAVIGDLELLALSQKAATLIGITGTNGKSTTTTLIGHILKSAGKQVEIGGNLGQPALSLALLAKDGIYVIEASSYQLDLIDRARFHVAVWLNITPDHLDRHGDMQGYMAAKKNIFKNQTASDIAVIGIDDRYSAEVAASLSGQKVIPISVRQKTDGVYVQNGILHEGENQFDLTGIASLTGAHNWQNAAASYAACKVLGCAPEAIYQALKTFGGLRHRLQLVATIKNVRFINDSKATNADAASHALAPYRSIYWIAGGKAKAGGISSLEKLFSHIKHAFLIGEAAPEFAKTLQNKVPLTQSRDLKNAVQQAAEAAWKSGDKEAVVLLSPACASFDQWPDFEARGDAFCACVEALAHAA